MLVKALAYELPHRLQLPLSRLSLSDIRREVLAQGLVAKISGATLWRWFSADALRPWRHRSWIFPRDPDFAAKAGRILDLYNRVWKGRPLNAREFVISADEKSSIQARRRKEPTLAPAPARRVFWIMDNCSAHRGQKAVVRLLSQWPNAVLAPMISNPSTSSNSGS